MFRNKKTTKKNLPALEVDSTNVPNTSNLKSPAARIMGFLTGSPSPKSSNLLSPIRGKRTNKKGAKVQDSPFFSADALHKKDKESNVVAQPVEEPPAPLEETVSLPALIKVPSLTAPDSVLMHKGNKLFWRINRTIDFRIYFASSCGAIVIRSFDSELNFEFDPIILEWDKVVSQVKHSEAAASFRQAELDKHDRKMDHEEDEIFKRIRKEKAALERKKKTTRMTDEVFQHAQKKLDHEKEEELMKELDTFRGRVVQFLVNRFEAIKDQDEQIKTCITKRPSDASTPLEFDEGCVPVGVAHVGEDDSNWNKKECSSAIRRKSIDLLSGLDEANQATRKASDTQKTIQNALQVVKGLSLRTKKQSKFKTMVRRTIFKSSLLKTESILSKMGTPKSKKKVAPTIQEED